MIYDIDSVTVNGRKNEYIRFGSGAKNLLIIPGMSFIKIRFSAKSVTQAFAAFTEKFTVYVVDRCENMPVGYTVFDMANDVLSLMNTLNIEKTSIFGASQGGMIGMALAAYHPERVEKLVVGSSASRPNAILTDVMSTWESLSNAEKKRELNIHAFKKMYSPKIADNAEKLYAISKNNESDEDIRQFGILARASREFDVYNDLAKIKCPVLVIGAQNDCVTGVNASCEIAEKIGCDLYVYEDGYHAVYDEAPDYRERLYSFFNN